MCIYVPLSASDSGLFDHNRAWLDGPHPRRQSSYSGADVTREETIIDNFRLWTEDDILCLRPSGPMTAAVADELSARAVDILASHPHYYILGDLRDAGPISPKLRRRLAEFGASCPPRAIALFHASLFVQGINALLFGAINVLGQRKQPWKQCETEAEARKWLQTQRSSASDLPKMKRQG